MNVFYGDLAEQWSILSPVEEYEPEAAALLVAFSERRPAARTLLELGSGGGHLAFYLSRRLACHLTDVSEAMLEVSRRLNPGCTHVIGDMRTLDLGRTFDLVLAYDAIDHMTTEADLAAAFATAWRHLAPGGLACFLPDDLADTFEPGTDVSGSDAPDGSGARLFAWSEAVPPGESVATVHYSFLIRDRDGAVRTYYERHAYGLFHHATWERLLTQAGFVVEVARERTEDDRVPRTLFFGHKRADA